MTQSQLVILLISIATMLIPLGVVLYARFKKHIELKVITKIVTMVAFLVGLSSVLWVLHSTGQIEKDLYDNMTLTLAVSAIAFAFWQFRDSQIQEDRMKHLASVMTTRFVGYFPKNLRDINEVVSHASIKLDVMSDYVGYGHFSDPEEFQRYFRQLQDLSGRRVKIRMLVFTREEAERTYKTQFTDAQFLEQFKEGSRLMRYCEIFCHGFGENFLKKVKADGNALSTQEVTDLRTQFDRFMFDRQLFYMKDLLERGVEIKQTSDKLPFFLWCEDGHEAVFGFLHEHAANEREVAFRTRDGSLIEHTFEVKFEALWNDPKTVPVTTQGHAEPNWLHGVSPISSAPAAPAVIPTQPVSASSASPPVAIIPQPFASPSTPSNGGPTNGGTPKSGSFDPVNPPVGTKT
jgi:hypothetical protein